MSEKLLPVLTALIAVILLVNWFIAPFHTHLPVRVPGMDKPADLPALPQINLAGVFVRAAGVPAADVSGAWPRFRGEKLDDISTETVPLAAEWGAAGAEGPLVARSRRRVCRRRGARGARLCAGL